MAWEVRLSRQRRLDKRDEKLVARLHQEKKRTDRDQAKRLAQSKKQ